MKPPFLFFILLLGLLRPTLPSCKSTQLYTCPSSNNIDKSNKNNLDNNNNKEDNNNYVTDCLYCHSYKQTHERLKTCFERRLFGGNVFLWRDLVGSLVFFLSAGIATSCGVGGGGIYVPLGILLLQFSSKPATGLSQASIFGSSLGGFLLNIRNLHPNERIRGDFKLDQDGKIEDGCCQNSNNKKNGVQYYTRPLIDYDMALFLAPMEMAGAVLGVLIQQILPNWLFLGFAGIILALTCWKTSLKFRDVYKKEKQELKKAKQEESNKENSLLQEDNTKDAENVNADNDLFGIDEKEIQKKKEEYLRLDARQYPREKLLGLLGLWIGLTLLTFLKGGKGVSSLIGVTCSSPSYPVLIVCQFLWTLSFATYYGYRLIKNQQDRKLVHYPILPHDILWNRIKLRNYSFVTFLAGIIAGLIGIGGGMVLGPLMIVMGVHPRVSSSTTATMIVCTSSSVAIMFVTSGLVPWSYAAWFFSLCCLGSITGKQKIDGYVKKTGMASLLIGLLASIIGLATLGCWVILFLNLYKQGWCLEGFKKFCNV